MVNSPPSLTHSSNIRYKATSSPFLLQLVDAMLFYTSPFAVLVPKAKPLGNFNWQAGRQTGHNLRTSLSIPSIVLVNFMSYFIIM